MIWDIVGGIVSYGYLWYHPDEHFIMNVEYKYLKPIHTLFTGLDLLYVRTPHAKLFLKWGFETKHVFNKILIIYVYTHRPVHHRD